MSAHRILLSAGAALATVAGGAAIASAATISTSASVSTPQAQTAAVIGASVPVSVPAAPSAPSAPSVPSVPSAPSVPVASATSGVVPTAAPTAVPTTILPTVTENIQLAPFNNSGISGTAQASDDGTSLVTTGTATGMDPTKLYVSLWYGNGSVGSGPRACNSDQTLTVTQMLIGTWVGGSTRTLDADQAGPVTGVRLSQIGSMSIRQVTPAQLAALQAGRALAPTLLTLQACGSA